jgi:hypothetical protein
MHLITSYQTVPVRWCAAVKAIIDKETGQISALAVLGKSGKQVGRWVHRIMWCDSMLCISH